MESKDTPADKEGEQTAPEPVKDPPQHSTEAETVIPAAVVSDILPPSDPPAPESKAPVAESLLDLGTQTTTETPPNHDNNGTHRNPPVQLPCTCEVAKRGRGRHAATCPRFTPNKPKPETVASTSSVAELIKTAPESAIDHTAMAAAVFDMTTNGLALGLGPEWRAQNKEERELVITSLAAYFKSQDLKDIPPGWMLVAVVSMYSLPRVTQPSTKTKLVNAWLWLKDKFRRKKKA